VAVLEETQIRILQRIEFDVDRATLRPESIPVLERVAAIIRENPQIAHVRIEGHTDSRHSHAHNRGLSRRRATTVLNWLRNEGRVVSAHLEAIGHGETRPIADNNTEEGRQTNRRVEFHWTGEEQTP
jgi:OOP family OmpA-OmpF porin